MAMRDRPPAGSLVRGLALLALLAAGCTRAEPPAPPVAAPMIATPPRAATPPASETVTAASTPAPEPEGLLEPEPVTLRPGDPGWQFLRPAEAPQSVPITWQAEPAGVVQVDASGHVTALGPGQATVRAVAGNRSWRASIEVPALAARPWDFAADVLPLFTRFGCNLGGCHGRAEGQNGFHLSLFGYDPAGDHRALTREAGGRRIEPIAPEASLLVRKATGRVPHGGGVCIPVGSTAERTLLDWIAAGAPEQRGASLGALTEVRIEPARVRLDAPGPAQVRLIARYADGHRRDVTRLSTFRSNDDSAATVDPDGRAVLDRRAEVDLVARFGSRVLTTRLTTPIDPELSFDFAALKRSNVIDEELFRRLEELKIPPSPAAGDAAFLRRVSLDLTGQLPQPDEVRAFLADTEPEKRRRKVDELMGRKEFRDFWLLKFGDLLQISQARFGNGAGAYQYWLTKRWEQNARWDAMVRELLTALGNPADFREGGPVNYALDGGGDPKLQAELTAQRFLGLRLRCAQCHDHPLDVWSQDDYFGLAAVFARVGRDGGPGPGGMMSPTTVRLLPEGKVEHLRTREPATPRLLDGTPVEAAPDADPRRVLADWITAPENPYFARAFANWAWAQFFGKGLVEPADDLSAANPAVHPELLDALARHFVASGYDIRDLIRTIVGSEAYGLSSTPVPGNAQDTRFFSHHLPRPLTAHQLADAIAQATNVPDLFPNRGTKARTKAIEIFDPGTPSAVLDTFGRCNRVVSCSPVATPSLSLRQTLLLIGGDAIDGKVAGLNGYLSELLAMQPPAEPAEIVEYLYFRTLSRPPTAEERSHWTALLREAPDRREAAEDLFWALLNAREFAFNH